MSLHKDLFWISGYNDRFPGIPEVGIVNNVMRISAFDRFSRNRRYYPRSGEVYRFWRYYFPNFQSDGYSNIQPAQVDRCIKALRRLEKVSAGNRLITKLTGMSRVEYIEALFKNPTIIWIDRNPISVILSYYKQRWMYKNRLSEFEKKSQKDLLWEYTELYKKFIRDSSRLEAHHFIRVQYENLVEDRFEFFDKILKFSDLDMNSEFLELLKSWNIRADSNKKSNALLEGDNLKYIKTWLAQA